MRLPCTRGVAVMALTAYTQIVPTLSQPPNRKRSGRGVTASIRSFFPNFNLTRRRRVVDRYTPSKGQHFTATNIGPVTKCGEVRYPRPLVCSPTETSAIGKRSRSDNLFSPVLGREHFGGYPSLFGFTCDLNRAVASAFLYF